MYNQQAYALGTNRSCIRDLSDYGQLRAAAIGAENVFDYTIGNPSLPAPPEIAQTIRELLDTEDPVRLHSYTSAPGEKATRQAIADDLNTRYHTEATADELFLGCGSSAELAAVFQALAFPGAQLLVCAPFFPEYRPLAEGAGLEFMVVPPDIPTFQIRIDLLEAMLTKHTAAVIVNSPSNPVGTVYTEQTLRQLAAVLTRKSKEYGHPIYIISDEPYRELVYGNAIVPFIPKLYTNTIVCYSYSKSLSIPGGRIGYVYIPREADDSAALYAAVAGASRALGHICAPSLWQKVIAKCAHLRPDLVEYDRNRMALYTGLTEIGYQVAKPDGAFYLFAKAPNGDANAFSKIAMQRDLLLVPGDDFGCPGWFRLCYCVPYEKILRSLPVFRALMEEVNIE